MAPQQTPDEFEDDVEDELDDEEVDDDEDETTLDDTEEAVAQLPDDLDEDEQKAVADIDATERVMNIIGDIVGGLNAASHASMDWLDVAGNAAALLSFEDVVSVMQATREGSDVGAWVDGDLLVGMMVSTSESSVSGLIEKVAAATGRSVAELRQRHDCSKFWPPSIRRTILTKEGAETLSWSHFDRARRGLEFEDACDLVESALTSGWSVRAMEAERMSKREAISGVQKDALTRKVEFAINALRSLTKEESVPPDLLNSAFKMIEKLEAYRATR